MSERKKIQKNTQPETENRRINYQTYQKIRVFQKNLVFVTGLPFGLGDPEVLKSQPYFGRYGEVNKIIVKTIPGYKKISSHQAYVTYNSELEASLAVVALDGFRLEQRPLKASYGTTKYCSHFLKGYECRNSQCYFLHQFEKKREIVNGDTRNAFKQQNNEALDIVCKNLEQVIFQMSLQEGKNEGFPSFKEMVDFLIDSGYTDQKQIKGLKKKIKLKNKKKEINYVQVPKAFKQVKSQFPEKSQQVQSQIEQLLKIKSEDKRTYMQKNRESQVKVERLHKAEKQIKSQKQVSLADTREFQLQDRIQTMIIKKLFRTNTKAKSKMNFVKSDKAYTDELVKLRGMVQQYLINNN